MRNETSAETRFNKNNPCPVCGTGTKGCSVKADGLHWCRGERFDTAVWKMLKAGEPFSSFRRIDDTTNLRNGHRVDPKPHIGKKRAPNPKPNAKPGKPQTWHEEAMEHCGNNSKAIAENLGLPVEMFAAMALKQLPLMGLGYAEYGVKDDATNKWVGAVTMPMVDGTGEPCGLTKRFDQPVSIKGEPPRNKNTSFGSTIGIYAGCDWKSRPGPILIPEGGSDVVALAGVGLAVLGRHSNTTGAEILAELLRNLPADRRIIIVGENDRDDVKGWPGRDGVEVVGPKLAALLGRPVFATYPPEEHKDCRVWIQDLLAGQAEGLDLAAVGETIREHIERTAVQVRGRVEDFADVPTGDSQQSTPQEPRFKFIDSATFAGGDYRPSWFIKNVLVRGQPGVIAGPSKGMKTSIVVDAAISLAAGRPFLGEFEIPKPVRVAVVSGESGEHTLQETAFRICAARGVSLASLGDRLQWCFDLPSFPEVAGMQEFAGRLLELKSELVILDPTYLCLGDIDAKNLFEMGQAFRVVADVLLKAGVTPILVHHANRQMKVGEVMELTHLAYSGLEQFCRQFILINRADPYQSDGEHRLWVRIGGSAGHGNLLALHVSEGVTDENFGGRKWDVTVASADEAKAEHRERREQEKEESVRQKEKAEETAVLNAVDAEMSKGNAAASTTSIARRTRIDKRKLPPILDRLTEDGILEEHKFDKKSGRGNGHKVTCTGYRRPPSAPAETDLITDAEERLHRAAEEQKTAAETSSEDFGGGESGLGVHPQPPPPIPDQGEIGGGASPPVRGDATLHPQSVDPTGESSTNKTKRSTPNRKR